MRTITHADLRAAAKALGDIRADDWARFLRRTLDEAHAADCYRKRTGCAHPTWGNGSLMSALSGSRYRPESFLSDAQYLLALVAVIEAVLEWRQRAH